MGRPRRGLRHAWEKGEWKKGATRGRQVRGTTLPTCDKIGEPWGKELGRAGIRLSWQIKTNDPSIVHAWAARPAGKGWTGIAWPSMPDS